MADTVARPPGSGHDGPFQGLLNWLRQFRGKAGAPNLRDELEELIEEHDEEGTSIDPHERRLLGNIQQHLRPLIGLTARHAQFEQAAIREQRERLGRMAQVVP